MQDLISLEIYFNELVGGMYNLLLSELYSSSSSKIAHWFNVFHLTLLPLASHLFLSDKLPSLSFHHLMSWKCHQWHIQVQKVDCKTTTYVHNSAPWGINKEFKSLGN
jgi:hypothetical protein